MRPLSPAGYRALQASHRFIERMAPQKFSLANWAHGAARVPRLVRSIETDESTTFDVQHSGIFSCRWNVVGSLENVATGGDMLSLPYQIVLLP